jgi:hypothetical protein
MLSFRNAATVYLGIFHAETKDPILDFVKLSFLFIYSPLVINAPWTQDHPLGITNAQITKDKNHRHTG